MPPLLSFPPRLLLLAFLGVLGPGHHLAAAGRDKLHLRPKHRAEVRKPYPAPTRLP